MPQDARFRSTYIALVALAWQSLERVDQKLDTEAEGSLSPDMHPRLQLLRLELVQLSDKSGQLVECRIVSMQQDTLIQDLVARLLSALDLDVTATTEVAQMRIRNAQNWLFQEANLWASIESQRCNVRRA